MSAAVQLALPLAKSGEAVKAGPIGLAVILIMCIACYFLFKSMSKHMRKVRENFPAEQISTATRPADKTAVAPAAASAPSVDPAPSTVTTEDEPEPPPV